ncbi:glycoside hydrolase family 3 N-terminal domain-containing protein [Lactobacillus sp.]|uniref:glycoside hydrolase family 3 N-terminal domain-containing protein n=1 Tax=Lactobacillus sp. TaxID=1591 RepID=UPI003EF6F7B3
MNNSLQSKLSQLFFIDSLGDFQKNLKILQNCQPSGIILFAKDLEGKSRARVKQELAAYKQARPQLFIGIDQEGGLVSRLSALSSNFYPSQGQLLAQGLDVFLQKSRETALELKDLGFNWNFAPVADFAKQKSSFIYNRTFQSSLEETSRAVAAFVKLYQELGLVSTAKHFPGYGDAGDTHTAFAIDNRTRAEAEADLLPFKVAIAAGVPSIMVAHLAVTIFDDQPVSLSKKVHGYLRQELGYGGIILTDDLAMAAAKLAGSEDEPAELVALKAGNDLLLGGDLATLPRLVQATENGLVSERQIDDSLDRLQALRDIVYR